MEFVDRKGSEIYLKTLEKNVKNKFKWVWLEGKDKNETFYSDYLRKLKEPGVAAYQKVKYVLLNEEKTAVEYFARSDPITAPVDQSINHHIQTAYTRVKAKTTKIKDPFSNKKHKIHENAEAERKLILENANAYTRVLAKKKGGDVLSGNLQKKQRLK